jgi:glycosyltransferase involved in cell wall biosynthesis
MVQEDRQLLSMLAAIVAVGADSGVCYSSQSFGFGSRTPVQDHMPQPLTVLIPCKDERHNLLECIESVRDLADEILVADSGSTDGTLELAKGQPGVRVIEREYVHSADFKNWAIPQAANTWVLILDADERIPRELAAEIRRTLAQPACDGYWIDRLNHFLGHPIHYGPWSGDRCLRLFRRDLGRYVGATDHAEVEVRNGSVGRLKHPMVHYTFTSYLQYLPKVYRYADVQARIWHHEGRQATRRQLLFRGPLRFLQGYLWRRGYRDGLAGLQVCALVAYLSYLKQARLWELEHARDWRVLEGEALTALDADDASGRTAA